MNNISNQNKSCAVIPFYNEENTIAELVNRTLKFVDAVIAVNDGSTDNSLNKIPRNTKVILLENSANRGKGSALNKGFNESIKRNFEFTVTLDADLQHQPENIPDFLTSLKNYDIVIGNRLENVKDMPLQRILSNKITSFLLSLKTGQSIIDSQCGYRAYRTKILPEILPSSSGYEAESEILINAARKNYRIGFVKIPAIYGEEKSKMKPFDAIAGFIKILFSKK